MPWPTRRVPNRASYGWGVRPHAIDADGLSLSLASPTASRFAPSSLVFLLVDFRTAKNGSPSARLRPVEALEEAAAAPVVPFIRQRGGDVHNTSRESSLK